MANKTNVFELVARFERQKSESEASSQDPRGRRSSSARPTTPKTTVVTSRAVPRPSPEPRSLKKPDEGKKAKEPAKVIVRRPDGSEKKADDLRLQLEASNAKNEELQKQIALLEKEKEQLEKEKEQLEVEKGGSDKERDDELQQLLQDVEVLKRKAAEVERTREMLDAAEEKAAALEAEAKELRSRTTTQRVQGREMGDLKEIAEKASKEGRKAEREAKEAKADAERLHEEVEREKRRAVRETERARLAESDLEDMRRKNDDLKTEIVSLKKQASDAVDELKALKESLGEAEKREESAKVQVGQKEKDLEKALEKEQKMNRGYQGQVKDLQKQVNAAEKRLREMRHSCESVEEKEKELQEVKEKLENEEKQRKEAEDARKSDRQRMEGLEAGIEALKKRLDSTRLNQADAETTVVETEFKVEELVEQLKEKDREIDELKKVEQNQDDSGVLLKEAEDKIAHLEQELETEKVERAKDQEKHENEMKEKSSTPLRPKTKPKPSPRRDSSDEERMKSPTRVGAKNAALQSKLFGSGAVPLPGVAPVQLRKSEEREDENEDTTDKDPGVLPRLTSKFDRPKRDVRVPSREFRQSLVLEAEKSEFALYEEAVIAHANESEETNGDMSDGQ